MPGSIVEARREGPALPSVPGSVGRRGTAIALALWLEALLAGQARCGPDDACPSCREGAGCLLNTWPQAVASLAIADTEAAVDAFWSAGDDPATQGFSVMRPKCAPLADAVLPRCLAFWRSAGKDEIARVVAHQAWSAGCRDPEAAGLHAEVVAAGGRPADLHVAMADCDATLGLRGASTDPAWNGLVARSAWFEARIAALEVPPERRHHPINPRRPARTPRFLRAS